MDSTSSQLISNGGAPANSIGLTAGPRAFSIGETAILTGKLTITGTPTYDAVAHWSLGFRDWTTAVGAALSLRLGGATLRNASTDTGVGGLWVPTSENGMATHRS